MAKKYKVKGSTRKKWFKVELAKELKARRNKDKDNDPKEDY